MLRPTQIVFCRPKRATHGARADDRSTVNAGRAEGGAERPGPAAAAPASPVAGRDDPAAADAPMPEASPDAVDVLRSAPAAATRSTDVHTPCRRAMRPPARPHGTSADHPSRRRSAMPTTPRP